MNNKLQNRYLAVLFSLLFALIAQWPAAFVAQASALNALAIQQTGTCQITVKPGWRPHRVQADDTLAALAARGGVTVDDLMQRNCLTSETIEVGALVLTPKLGLAIPTATPTSVPMPTITAAPTIPPTASAPTIVILEEPTATPLQESATLTPTVSLPAAAAVISTTTATATATATVVVASNSNGTPPTSSSPISKNGIIALSLLIMGVVSALFFALQPRNHSSDYKLQAKSPVIRDLAPGGLVANIFFMIAGFVIGAMLFPMLRMPSFVELPTWLNVTAVVGLIGLLAVKEVFLGALQWRGLNRILNLGIAPLLMIFLLSVITRFADVIH